jgi:hypothetical protein
MLIVGQYSADETGRSPEGHEEERKSPDEEQRIHDDGVSRYTPLGGII